MCSNSKGGAVCFFYYRERKGNRHNAEWEDSRTKPSFLLKYLFCPWPYSLLINLLVFTSNNIHYWESYECMISLSPTVACIHTKYILGLWVVKAQKTEVFERKYITINFQIWNKTAWLSTTPVPVLRFIITIKLEPYRSLLCPAVKLIFFFFTAWQTTPEPLLFIRHMNSPEGRFGAHASLFGELGIAAHESVIKTHLLEDWR